MPYALGNVKPHVKAAAEEVGKKFNVATIYGVAPRPGGSGSLHPSGRALDFMVYNDKAKGDAIANYCWENRLRLGVIEVIWYQRIITVQRQSEGWRAMPNRGSNTANHKDHPHISFNATGGVGGLEQAIIGGLSETAGPVFGGAAEAAGNAAGIVSGTVETLAAYSRIAAWLTNPQNWMRVLMVIAGAVAILISLFTWDRVQRAASQSVAKVKGAV